MYPRTRRTWRNSFTLDFLTPLLPVGVPVAWLGVMEGAADASAQVLKLSPAPESRVTTRGHVDDGVKDGSLRVVWIEESDCVLRLRLGVRAPKRSS